MLGLEMFGQSFIESPGCCNRGDAF